MIRWLHLAWALLCLTACALLTFGEGHPPGIIFVPAVLIAWAGGHGALLAVRKLAAAGAHKTSSRSWPVSLVLTAVASGLIAAAASLLGLSAAFGSAAMRGSAGRWILLAGAGHAVLLVMILLRWRWVHLMSAAAAVLWATEPVRELLMRPTGALPRRVPEQLVLVGMICALGGFAWHVARSVRVRRFLRGEAEKPT